MRPTLFSGKRLYTLLHVTAWILILLIPYIIHTLYGLGSLRHLFHIYIFLGIYGIIFYVNYLLLIPRLYFHEKKSAYLLAAVGLILVMFSLYALVNYFAFNEMPRPGRGPGIPGPSQPNPLPRPPFQLLMLINFFSMSVLITGFSFGLRVLTRLNENEQKRKELEKEKLNSELAFLKNQVSPHFFFNTLNNIYALIGMDAPLAQQSVLNLAKLMRYLLYESEQGTTRLSHEIGFMQNYIELMKLRLSPGVDLAIDFPQKFEDFEVPPLLFIPFIENAFKHSLSFRNHSFIHIALKLTSGKILFTCLNSVGESSQPGDGQHSGIGLENVRKRLNLLFPHRHHLQISEKEGEFNIFLDITLET